MYLCVISQPTWILCCRASGMLCSAMAMAMTMPAVGSASVPTKVARPSGRLWMPMARAASRPARVCGYQEHVMKDVRRRQH
jgi:hypothetical protein